MDLFSHKTASDRLEDVNVGASSLRYDEVRSKNAPVEYRGATSLQFEFSQPGRHILLSESYFEIDYDCYKRNYNQAIADETKYIAIDGNEYVGTGQTQNANTELSVCLRRNFVDLTLNAVRHSINGRQIGSTNDCALTRTFKNTQMAHGYSSAGASVQYGQFLKSDRVDQLRGSKKHAVAWCPPLGLWDSSTAIPGSAVHNITIDMKPFSAYNAAIFDVDAKGVAGDDHDKLTTDFIFTEDRGTASTLARQQFYFQIKDIRLRVASVSPQDMRLPPQSLLLETREIEVHRVETGPTNACNKQILVPGSLYKTNVLFLADNSNNNVVKCAEVGDNFTDTKLTNLSIHVDGNQLPSPEYVFDSDGSMGSYMRAYIDYLNANGTMWSEQGVSGIGVDRDFTQWVKRPIYSTRIVTPPSVSKDILVRANFGTNTNKTLVVGTHYTKAVVLEFGPDGLVSGVTVSEYA